MIRDLYDKQILEQCESLRNLLVHRDFDKKMLKQCEFLRTLLEHYGIRWKFKLERKDNYMTTVSFLPMFNGLYLHHNVDKILFNLYDDERFYTENEHDLILGISTATLDRFYNYGKSNTTFNEFTKVKKILDNTIVYNSSGPSEFAISAIDFEGTIQNMILDGTSLEGFPALEEIF